MKVSDPLKVMVVEDSKEFQEVVVLTLGLQPYFKVVAMADSGQEALAVFETASPDLVLLDYRLPGIDGVETAKRLKSRRPDIKMALVTAFAHEIPQSAVEEAQLDAVIPKSEFTLSLVQESLGREPA